MCWPAGPAGTAPTCRRPSADELVPRPRVLLGAHGPPARRLDVRGLHGTRPVAAASAAHEPARAVRSDRGRAARHSDDRPRHPDRRHGAARDACDPDRSMGRDARGRRRGLDRLPTGPGGWASSADSPSRHRHRSDRRRLESPGGGGSLQQDRRALLSHAGARPRRGGSRARRLSRPHRIGGAAADGLCPVRNAPACARLSGCAEHRELAAEPDAGGAGRCCASAASPPRSPIAWWRRCWSAPIRWSST